MNRLKLPQGFTLIEVLIALLVLAIIASMGVVGLQAILRADERQETITNQFAELQFAYLLIQHDVTQVIQRYIVDASNEQRPAFLGTAGNTRGIPFDVQINGNLLLEFTRDGVSNPQQLKDRTTLQRVTYTLDDQGLLRRYAWLTLDRVSSSPFLVHELLKDIKELKLTYYDRFGQVFTQWNTIVPTSPTWLNNLPQMNVLPAAMEWRFLHPRYGEVVWLFLMPGADHVETIT